MKYNEFIDQKKTTIQNSGFDVAELNSNLFPFQAHCVKTALKKGRFALFEDCGLGKTFQQLEWAYRVSIHTNKPVLVLCPLAVAGQTIAEGDRFGIKVNRFAGNPTEAGIYITNYEQLDHIDSSFFSGVVLDESSILKNYTGKYKKMLIDMFADTPYKLACTATPSPNDLNELGNHAEFLNVMDSADMRMRWFVRDEGMNNYRLKGHAEKDFFSWVSSWAVMIQKPSDIGFCDDGYNLPKLNFIEHEVKSEKSDNGKLFNDVSVSATEFHGELRRTLNDRLSKVVELVNSSDGQVIVWIEQNREEKALRQLIPEAIFVNGSEKPESKERKLLGFARGEFRILVTKPKIAQYGMNFQNCNNQIFASIDFSFEKLYQAIRRSYRFGQKKQVNINIITIDTMGNVMTAIERKEQSFEKMKANMSKEMNSTRHELKSEYDKREIKNANYHIINGDSVVEIDNIEDNSIDFSVFSPPFSTLFTYSDNIRDMGNCVDDAEFFEQNKYLLDKLYQKIKPGRLVAVHTKDIARYKNSSGYTGLYDFTGEYHRAMLDAGFKYHSKITIWTDPVLEMQRTKTQRLLYKQVTSDSSYTGVGLPEYVTIFRKWEGDESEWNPICNKTRDKFSLDTWQRWASPIWNTTQKDIEEIEKVLSEFHTQSWMDIRRTDVITNWRHAKGKRDEKHICPLQLSVVRRCVQMWSNPGEVVFSPFAGIGSEGYEALKLGRKFKGIELKPEYYDFMAKNLNAAIQETLQPTLF